MARLPRTAKGKADGVKAVSVKDQPDPALRETVSTSSRDLPLPSPRAATNLMIADIVLRAAGGLVRNRLGKGVVIASHNPREKGRAKAEKLVDNRSFFTSLALWGASRIATRSPLGLAVVAGGLAAKALYDRGKRIERGPVEAAPVKGRRAKRKRTVPTVENKT